MTAPEVFEFLLVSTSYETLTVVARAAKVVASNLGFVPTIELARDYMGRRKVDGIFVDMEIPGAGDLIGCVRQGVSNRNTVVFACIPPAADSPVKLVTGANFVLQKPLSEDSVAFYINAAKEIMARERRRFFRHSVNVSVILKADGKEQRARVTDVSEGGMAVHVVNPVRSPSVVEFCFELAPGEEVCGKGIVAWANNQGMIGVKFQFIRGKGSTYLDAWIKHRQDVSLLDQTHKAHLKTTK